MLTAFILIVVNLLAFTSMGTPKPLGAERFSALVGEQTAGGWLVLLGSWLASWRYKRRIAADTV